MCILAYAGRESSSGTFSEQQSHQLHACLVVTVMAHNYCGLEELQKEIKGPDNPTSQLLPIISMKACRRDGERRLGKGGGEGSRS